MRSPTEGQKYYSPAPHHTGIADTLSFLSFAGTWSTTKIVHMKKHLVALVKNGASVQGFVPMPK